MALRYGRWHDLTPWWDKITAQAARVNASKNGYDSRRVLNPDHDLMGTAGEWVFALEYDLVVNDAILKAGDKGTDFNSVPWLPETVDVKAVPTPARRLIQYNKPLSEWADWFVLAQVDTDRKWGRLLGCAPRDVLYSMGLRERAVAAGGNYKPDAHGDTRRYYMEPEQLWQLPLPTWPRQKWALVPKADGEWQELDARDVAVLDPYIGGKVARLTVEYVKDAKEAVLTAGYARPFLGVGQPTPGDPRSPRGGTLELTVMPNRLEEITQALRKAGMETFGNAINITGHVAQQTHRTVSAYWPK